MARSRCIFRVNLQSFEEPVDGTIKHWHVNEKFLCNFSVDWLWQHAKKKFQWNFQLTWAASWLKRPQQTCQEVNNFKFQVKNKRDKQQNSTSKPQSVCRVLTWKTSENYNWNVHFQFQHVSRRETQYQALHQHQKGYLWETAASIQAALLRSMMLQFN